MKNSKTTFNSLTSVLAACITLAVANVLAIESENTSWTWSGWGGGGYFWSNAIDPSNPDIMYLGGDVVGIYKSTDRGKNWHFINKGLHEYGVYSMAIAKSNPQVLYAMTPNGIARTSDGGANWTPLAETLRARHNLSSHRPVSVRALAIDPTNPDLVYAGSAIGVASRSVDGGQTWSSMNYMSGSGSGRATGGLVPASGEGYLKASFKSVANDWEHSGRIERYFDAGQDWSGMGTLSASFYAPAGAPTLKVSLVVQSGTDWKWESAPFVDSKAGEWVEVKFDLATLHDIKNVRMVHVWVMANGAAFTGEVGIDAVRVKPTNPAAREIVLGEWDIVGASEGWRVSKTDKTTYITDIKGSLSQTSASTDPISSVVVSEANPATIFICHSKLGVFKSSDAGASWKALDTPPKANHLAVHPKNANIIYGAFDRDGVWKSEDGGTTWAKFSNGISADTAPREIHINPRNPEIIHLIANRSWVGTYYRSTDAGKTWVGQTSFARDFTGNPTEPDGHENGRKNLSSSTNLALSPSDPNTVFISANWNNIVSTDGGTTWRESSRGADITCFHDLRFVEERIFGVAMDEGLLTSTDNGKTWKQLYPRKYTGGESGHNWRVAAFRKPDGEYHVVSTVSPWRTSEAFPNHVIVSQDSGATFRKATGLLDYRPKSNTMWGEGYARALAADPANPLTMYLGIDGDPEGGKPGGGVFKSLDGGLTWRQLENQPGSRRMFYGLVVDPTNPQRLYWGGFGTNGGVWRSENGGTSWERMSCPDSHLFNVEVTNDGTVYAGGNDLWRSVDQGMNWEKISNFEGRRGSVVGIAFDPADARRIWFSSVTWDGSSSGGIYRTVDGGRSWTDICGDIPYRKPLILRYNSKTQELWAVGVGAFRTSQHKK